MGVPSEWEVTRGGSFDIITLKSDPEVYFIAHTKSSGGSAVQLFDHDEVKPSGVFKTLNDGIEWYYQERGTQPHAPLHTVTLYDDKRVLDEEYDRWERDRLRPPSDRGPRDFREWLGD